MLVVNSRKCWLGGTVGGKVDALSDLPRSAPLGITEGHGGSDAGCLDDLLDSCLWCWLLFLTTKMIPGIRTSVSVACESHYRPTPFDGFSVAAGEPG